MLIDNPSGNLEEIEENLVSSDALVTPIATHLTKRLDHRVRSVHIWRKLRAKRRAKRMVSLFAPVSQVPLGER